MKWTVLFVAGFAGTLLAGEANPVKTFVVEDASLRQLLTVRRVYVDRLTGGETAAQMRDILMSSLQGTGLFVLTENQERADAVLRGAAEDLVYSDVHNSSDGVNRACERRYRPLQFAGLRPVRGSRLRRKRK